MHAVKETEWTLVDSDKLEQRCDDASDVTPIAVAQSHYYYRFISDNKVKIKWLSCPCTACLSKQWDDCFNKEWIGDSTLVEIKQLDKRGLGRHKKRRKDKSNKIADSPEAEDTVVVYTQEDPNRCWLGQVTSQPGCDDLAPTLESDSQCPVSGEGFKAGERVFYVTYYERIPRVGNPCLFNLK